MESSFEPKLWIEDKLPKEAEGYRKCEICTEKSRVIWGEGNPKAPVMIILDNPGAREDKYGNAYVCGTRQTLQRALDEANIAPDDIYVTYLLKCRPLRRYNKEEARAFSKPFLIQQIAVMQPEFIVCLGDIVVQAMFDDRDARVKDLRGVWHEILGRPCMVSYHPLAVRRRPNLMRLFMEDWDMLARRLFAERQ
ncbi:MAG: Uracil DNA glycosylase superfamily protein [Firmicutes bacterium ADurb.Bin300]|nr:MAG: Uracil DNA glycosylase superfamily protein [Firmicutes bacterium ADurb.Bin300]